MDFIKRRLSRVNPILRNKANEEHPSGQDCPWGDLRHAMGRLRSYLEAVQILAEARAQPSWEALFHHPEVTTLRSSSPACNPILPHADMTPPTADAILNRMASTEADRLALPALQDHAVWLQQFDLDPRISAQCRRPGFHPIVHAEVLVHESLVTDRGGDPDVRRLHVSRFFGGWRYIGVSKPTCRLCEYYFAAVPADGVRVRQGHRNLYLNWRAPDVYREPLVAGEGEGEDELVRGRTGTRRRECILNDMIKSVRSDTVRVLDDKVGERKSNDSNTSRTYQLDFFSVENNSLADRERGGEEDVDDTASMMGQLDLED